MITCSSSFEVISSCSGADPSHAHKFWRAKSKFHRAPNPVSYQTLETAGSRRIDPWKTGRGHKTTGHDRVSPGLNGHRPSSRAHSLLCFLSRRTPFDKKDRDDLADFLFFRFGSTSPSNLKATFEEMARKVLSSCFLAKLDKSITIASIRNIRNSILPTPINLGWTTTRTIRQIFV